MERYRNLPYLIWVNLYVSSFTFGGGYVIMPMLRRCYVEKKQLFTEEEFLDMAAVAQSSPGAIAINLSALTGKKAAGIPGAVVSCIAAVTPPIVALSLVCLAYDELATNRVIAAALKGMMAAAAALMIHLAAGLCRTVFISRNLLFSLMIPVAFLAAFVWKINIALIIVGCAMVGMCAAAARPRKEEGQ